MLYVMLIYVLFECKCMRAHIYITGVGSGGGGGGGQGGHVPPHVFDRGGNGMFVPPTFNPTFLFST